MKVHCRRTLFRSELSYQLQCHVVFMLIYMTGDCGDIGWLRDNPTMGNDKQQDDKECCAAFHDLHLWFFKEAGARRVPKRLSTK